MNFQKEYLNREIGDGKENIKFTSKMKNAVRKVILDVL
jgi:hypothetical protein